MADKFTVKVDLHGTEEALIALGPKVAKLLVRRVLRAVGKTWTEELKAKVPRLTGALRDSINFKVTTGKKDNGGTVTVGPTYDSKELKKMQDTSQSPGVYGKFVEFGLTTKQYPAQPFMRPVFDSSAERMIEFVAEDLRENLEDAVK